MRLTLTTKPNRRSRSRGFLGEGRAGVRRADIREGANVQSCVVQSKRSVITEQVLRRWWMDEWMDGEY